MPARVEVFLGRGHLHVLQLVAERDEVVVARVLDDQHVARSLDDAARARVDLLRPRRNRAAQPEANAESENEICQF